MVRRFSALFLLLAACSSEAPPVESRLAEAPAPTPSEEPAPPVEAPKPDPLPAKAKQSPGCNASPTSKLGAITKRALGDRVYHLALPSSYDATKPRPLVFVFHGAGDTEPETMHDWFPIAKDMSSAIFVYPQALPRTRSDGSGGKIPRWDLSGDDDLKLFDAIVTDVGASHCVDQARIFTTGFSSGGNFSQNLACLRQDTLRAFAVVAGPGPFATKCKGAIAAWMTHDVNDDALPVSGARSSRDFWSETNGCGSSWSSDALPDCQRNTTCTSSQPVVYCETKGTGHGVPAFATPAIAQFFGSF